MQSIRRAEGKVNEGNVNRGGWLQRWACLPLAFLLGRLGLVGSVSSLGPALWSVKGLGLRWPLPLLIILGVYTRSGLEGVLLALVQLLAISLLRKTWPGPGTGVMSLTLAHLVKLGWVWVRVGPTLYEGWIWVLELMLLAGTHLLLTRTLSGTFSNELEHLLASVMLAALGVAGTWGWELGGVRLWTVAAPLVVLLAAARRHALAGGPAGIIVGSALSLGSYPSGLLIGFLSLLGVLMGAMSSLGKGAMALGTALLGGLLLLGMPSSTLHLPSGLELGLAGGIFLLVHRDLSVLPWGRGGPVWRWQGEESTGERLRALTAALREISRALEVEDEEETPRRRADAAAMVNRLVAEVCRACPGYSGCWDKAFHSTYNWILDLVAGAQEDPSPSCRKKDLMRRYLERRREVARVEATWSQRAGLGRDLLTGQLEAVAEVLEDIIRPNGTLHPSPGSSPYRFTVAWRSAARQGSDRSGDSVMAVQSEDTLIAALSDGMGSGERAAVESRTLLNLLERLLQCGISQEAAIRTVNGVMLLRSTEELFATLDLLIADRRTGSCRFFKVGAAPAFINRAGKVRAVTADTLPVGIVEDLEVDVTPHQLAPGDVVVMVTDGVMSDDPEDPWLKRFLSRQLPPPETLARDILRVALGRSDGIPRDDMTVLVARMERRKNRYAVGNNRARSGRF